MRLRAHGHEPPADGGWWGPLRTIPPGGEPRVYAAVEFTAK